MFRAGTLHLAVLALVSILAIPAEAQHDQHQHEHTGTPPEELGTVHFPTSCRPDVQEAFDRGVALLHSFWFSEAIDAFRGVLARDPSCGTAYWGIALSQWTNPFAMGRTPELFEAGRVTVEQGQAVGAGTDRERGYLAAVGRLYTANGGTERERALAYESAMEALQARYPDDTEAAIFYALALTANAPPTDKTYARQLRAADILEAEFARQPDHPGLAHYIIHAYDVPPLAERALEAARRYAEIAPSAPHALHMPSHTFTRLGYWDESIETNRRSADAARDAASTGEELHALDYQVYAYLQLGQDAGARQVLGELNAIAERLRTQPGFGYGPVGAFALAAIPARYALERGAWAEAARLEPMNTPVPYTEAMTYFARALGKARSGNAASARADAAKLAELQRQLEQAGDAYWAEQVHIQRLAAEAWIALGDGRTGEALGLMREAAEIESGTEKHAITPGPLAPARELLAEMLLELDRPGEALREFEATLETEPRRFRATYGAGRAAEQAGAREAAVAHYRNLLAICEGTNLDERPELKHAQAFVGTGQ